MLDDARGFRGTSTGFARQGDLGGLDRGAVDTPILGSLLGCGLTLWDFLGVVSLTLFIFTFTPN